MGDNGDLKRNRAMSAGARRFFFFFFEENVRESGIPDVIREWGDRYRLPQCEFSARPKRLQRQLKDWLDATRYASSR